MRIRRSAAVSPWDSFMRPGGVSGNRSAKKQPGRRLHFGKPDASTGTAYRLCVGRKCRRGRQRRRTWSKGKANRSFQILPHMEIHTGEDLGKHLRSGGAANATS